MYLNRSFLYLMNLLSHSKRKFTSQLLWIVCIFESLELKCLCLKMAIFLLISNLERSQEACFLHVQNKSGIKA